MGSSQLVNMAHHKRVGVSGPFSCSDLLANLPVLQKPSPTTPYLKKLALIGEYTAGLPNFHRPRTKNTSPAYSVAIP